MAGNSNKIVKKDQVCKENIFSILSIKQRKKLAIISFYNLQGLVVQSTKQNNGENSHKIWNGNKTFFNAQKIQTTLQ